MGQERDDYADRDLPPADSVDDVLVGVGVYALIGVALIVVAVSLSPLGRELFR